MTEYVLVAQDSSPPGTYTGYQQGFSGSMTPSTFESVDIIRFEHDYGTDILYFSVSGDFPQDQFETVVIADSEQGEITFNSADATYGSGGSFSSWEWPNPSAGNPMFVDGGTYAVTIGSSVAPTPPTPDEPEEEEVITPTIVFDYPTFDVHQTVISQFANSPSILRIVENIAEYIDPRTNMKSFFDYVENVNTAQGFGLDIWGRIVGVSRLLQIPGNSTTFGFNNSDIPDDWAPFNQGTFYTGASAGQGFTLDDDTFRTLILVKALSNIVATTASSLNQLLRNLFPATTENPDRGRAWVIDNNDMTMTFYFEFDISTADYAILTQSGVLPHPAGVGYNVVVVPAGIFGFQEQGESAEPFDQGVFYQPPGT